MNSSISELIISAALGGVITGIVVPTLGEWLKGFFNGHHSSRTRKKQKESIINFLRGDGSPNIELISQSTSKIRNTLFKRRKVEFVHELLMELYREKRVDMEWRGGFYKTEAHWMYNLPKVDVFLG